MVKRLPSSEWFIANLRFAIVVINYDVGVSFLIGYYHGLGRSAASRRHELSWFTHRVRVLLYGFATQTTHYHHRILQFIYSHWFLRLNFERRERLRLFRFRKCTTVKRTPHCVPAILPPIFCFPRTFLFAYGERLSSHVITRSLRIFLDYLFGHENCAFLSRFAFFATCDLWTTSTMADDNDCPFRVEYAKSSRSKCKLCKDGIEKEHLRLAVMVQVRRMQFIIICGFAMRTQTRLWVEIILLLELD